MKGENLMTTCLWQTPIFLCIFTTEFVFFMWYVKTKPAVLFNVSCSRSALNKLSVVASNCLTWVQALLESGPAVVDSGSSFSGNVSNPLKMDLVCGLFLIQLVRTSYFPFEIHPIYIHIYIIFLICCMNTLCLMSVNHKFSTFYNHFLY